MDFSSATVGVVFGYFPARRASRLDPITVYLPSFQHDPALADLGDDGLCLRGGAACPSCIGAGRTSQCRRNSGSDRGAANGNFRVRLPRLCLVGR